VSVTPEQPLVADELSEFFCDSIELSSALNPAVVRR